VARERKAVAREKSRADAAVKERDRVQGELRLERIRLEDLRAELESARAEAAQLRERAVAAELRSS
jgi:hypothetical protein